MTALAQELPLDRASRARSVSLAGLSAVLSMGVLLQGGYWSSQAILLVAGFVVVLLLGTREGIALPLPVSIAFLSLAVGLGASVVAAGVPGSSTAAVATLVVAVAATVIAARVVRSEGPDALLDVVLAIGTLVAASGLVGLALHIEPLSLPVAGTWRLASVLTYSNAAAALFAMVLPLGAVAASRRPAAWRRIMLTIVGVALLGTLSRGGALAAVAGLAVVLLARAVRREELTGVASGVVVGGASLLPAVLGMRGAPAAAIGGLSVALMLATTHRRGVRKAGVWICGVTAAVAIAFIPFTRIAHTRLSFDSNDRARVWAESLERIDRDRILFGTGPGTFRLIAERDGEVVLTRYAHNEFIQALAETGVVGLGSIAVALGCLVGAVRRARPLHATAWAGIGAGAAFIVGSAFDFVWRIPVLVAIVFMALAIATVGQGVSGGAIEATTRKEMR